MKVLIIEDDRSVVETVILSFKVGWPGTKVIPTSLGLEGVDIVAKESPDLVILDLGLPDISGFEVLKQIRLFSTIPVIILSVRGEEFDIIKGLELGADEYVIKPFRQMELLARIKALLRRHFLPEGELPLVIGEFSFYPHLRKLVKDKQSISLTNTESLLLYHLAINSGKSVTYKSLATYVWGDVESINVADTLRVHICHLREKIESDLNSPKHIITNTGIGYSFNK